MEEKAEQVGVVMRPPRISKNVLTLCCMQAKQQKQNNNLLLLACTRGYYADV